jgi:hypothetical protein
MWHKRPPTFQTTSPHSHRTIRDDIKTISPIKVPQMHHHTHPNHCPQPCQFLFSLKMASETKNRMGIAPHAPR